jgi:hypothetical protein
MAIEGLRIVLEKEAVVGTPTADQLVQAPDAVDEQFMRHVRSYVPLGRATGSGEDTISVTEYEKRLIALVKEAKAPKGYITADFGYGKTSTALYLWHRCREAGLLAVPPFRLGKLDDLILATYGWARYEFGRRAPTLVARLDELYRRYSERSVEADAGGDADRAALLHELLREGRYTLALGAIDYLNFFEQITDVARDAGFEGLILLPDEVQQYIEPAVRAGMRDPIAPLFDIVRAFVTRKGQLRAGLIFSIPSKELGVINDQRADLVQRLKMDGLGLDLRAIYDQGFALRLWDRLAREFEFTAEAPRIVEAATLESLGQIASRDDLANGPRTVIAAFALMIRRYLDAGGRATALTPLGLIDAFLAGAIVFDNVGKLQAVVTGHLASRLVAERREYRDVVKLLGSFPTDGAARPTLEAAGLWEAFDELSRLAQGDIVITVGGGRDNQGRELPYGSTLRGLEPSSAVASDWLTQTIREFRRGYVDSADLTLQRAQRAFIRLLTTLVFREPEWRVVERIGERITDSAGLLLDGQFRASTKRFPERRVSIRLPREGEAAKGGHEADLTLDIALNRHFDVNDHDRRRLPGALVGEEAARTGHARLELNLFHRGSDLFYTDLQATLQPVLSPWQLSPLLLLALDEYLEEKRQQGALPKEDDREIARSFQPLLLEHAVDELFNDELGVAYDATRERIVEELLRRTWEARYPDYRTLIAQQNWRLALRDYETALERLPGPDERQGTESVTGTKAEIARLFNRSNVGFDTFVGVFPDFIEVVKPFKGQDAGAVTFRLHPFEGRIRDLLRGGQSEMIAQGGQRLTARLLPLQEAHDAGHALGYRQEEIAALLDIMVGRGLIEVLSQRGALREVVSPRLRLEDLQAQVSTALGRATALLGAFGDEALLQNQAQNLQTMTREIREAPATFDARKLRARTNTIRVYTAQIAQFIRDRTKHLGDEARRLGRLQLPDLREEYALDRPLRPQFFGQHLDVQREALATQAAALLARQGRIEAAAVAIIQRLSEDNERDSPIVQARTELDALGREAREAESDSNKLQTTGRRLAAARRALDGLIDLDQQLGLLAEGDSTDATSKIAWELHALQVRITAELSSRKVAALDGAATWEGELTRLRSLFSRQQEVQRETFDRRKERHLSLFRAHLGLPEGTQPLGAVYNPADPADAARRLTSEVGKSLDAASQRLAQVLQDRGAGLRQLLASPDLAEADDAARSLTAQGRALLKEIENALARVGHLREQAADLTVIEDIEIEGGRCEQLFISFAEGAAAVSSIVQRYHALQSRVEPSKLEVSERTLLETIREFIPLDGTPLELGTLLHQNGPNDQSAAEIWRLLAALYHKRRLLLHVSLPRDGRG